MQKMSPAEQKFKSMDDWLLLVIVFNAVATTLAAAVAHYLGVHIEHFDSVSKTRDRDGATVGDGGSAPTQDAQGGFSVVSSSAALEKFNKRKAATERWKSLLGATEGKSIDEKRAHFKKLKDEMQIWEDENLTEQDKRDFEHEKMLQSLVYLEPAFEAYNLIDKKARNPVPHWVPMLGDFQHVFAGFVVIVLISSLSWALLLREMNFLEMMGILPFKVLDPRIGVLVSDAKRQSILSNYGNLLSNEEQVLIYKRMMETDAREAYDKFGRFGNDLGTLGGLAKTFSDVLLFYLAESWLIFLLSYGSRRLRGSLNKAWIGIGILLFLDAGAMLGFGTSVHKNIVLSTTPGIRQMTSCQKLWLLRSAAVPTVQIACLFYSSHQYVDFEEQGLDFLLRILTSCILCERKILETIEYCQIRREKQQNGSASSGSSKSKQQVPRKRK